MTANISTTEWIPNIILGRDYDRRYLDSTIHYDALSNLARFFGREMPIHRHAQYVQIHFFDRDEVNFHIDQHIFHTHGQACFLTPASTPHSFLSSSECRGHVITFHESLAWQLQREGIGLALTGPQANGLCVEARHLNSAQQLQWQQLVSAFDELAREWTEQETGRDVMLASLLRTILIRLFRLSNTPHQTRPVQQDDLKLFRSFSALVEAHHTEHWTLPQYAFEVGVSESRLNQVCMRIANLSPKRIIHDRQIQEIKRLLTFTTRSSSEICYELGFRDPAYFARFFKRNTGVTAQTFRKQAHAR